MSTPVLLAHGLGGRTDLPIPRLLAVYSAGTAVIVSFLALAVLWKEPRLRGNSAGTPLPVPLARLLDSAAFRWVLRTLTLLFFLLVVVVAFAGPKETRFNLAPYVLYIPFWAGTVAVSLVLGPVWRVLNPLRTLHLGLAKLVRIDPDRGVRPLPWGVGKWPAAVWLGIFTWLELVYPERAEPHVVGTFLAVYAVVTVGLALVFGRQWFEGGDGFEVWFSLVARLSPWGRRNDGVLVVRSPLDGLSGEPLRPGLAAVVITLIGSTAFDGLTRTPWWNNHVAANDTPVGTLGLLGAIAIIGVLYVAAARTSRRMARLAVLENETSLPPASSFPGLFAATLVPIAVGYTIAHYFSLVVLDGQAVFSLLSDPFQHGWNVLGLRDHQVNYNLVSTGTIAVVQVAAVVIGHVLAVVAAHDRALQAVRPAPAATRSQYPMMVLMVALTCTAIGLLVGG